VGYYLRVWTGSCCLLVLLLLSVPCRHVLSQSIVARVATMGVSLAYLGLLLRCSLKAV
jgi:Na+-translocating ferredoxin:NAD+ oxidoreductase RnfA subunit